MSPAAHGYAVSMVQRVFGTALVLSLVVTAGCGDDDVLDEPTADVTTTVVGDPEATDEDPDAEITLDVALGSTIDAGSAGYTVFVTQSPLEHLEPAVDAPDAVTGRTEFTELRHEITVDLDGVERSIVRDGDQLLVELDDGWGRIALADLAELGGELGVAADHLVAMHDPGAVVRALDRSRAGAVVDDGEVIGELGAVPPDDDEQRTEMVPVPVDDIDDPFLRLLADETRTNELRVHVWFDAAGADGFVRRMAYDLGALRDPDVTGTRSGVDDGAGPGTDDDVAPHPDPAGGPFAVVDLRDIGDAAEVTVPDDEVVRDLEPAEFVALLDDR
jgi:hypothetical protein